MQFSYAAECIGQADVDDSEGADDTAAEVDAEGVDGTTYADDSEDSHDRAGPCFVRKKAEASKVTPEVFHAGRILDVVVSEMLSQISSHDLQHIHIPKELKVGSGCAGAGTDDEIFQQFSWA